MNVIDQVCSGGYSLFHVVISELNRKSELVGQLDQ